MQKITIAKQAFSLIELLITLIIISLLLAAFSPIITKKLKASDVTVGSFSGGTSEGNAYGTIKRDITKEDCDKFNALFIPASLNGGTKNVCATKYNMGDNNLPLAKNVKSISVGLNCTDNGNCCWKGKTSSTCTADGNGNSTYSGCNRTVCQWQAAANNCLEYAPNGTKKGDWRLPTQLELEGWSENLSILTLNQGKEGLQLCIAAATAIGSVKCEYLNEGCPQTPNKRCDAHHVWASTMTETDTYSNYAFDKYGFVKYEKSKYFANTNRCVLDHITETTEQKIELKNNAPKSQADCDKFNALFIPASMNDGTNNICVTKWNMGDNNLPITGAIVLSVGQTCMNPGNCCWKGKTSGTCTSTGNGDSVYSGCYRTVCNWNAADNACRFYAPKGTNIGSWRLPTSNEIGGWVSNISILNDGQGKNGLQLCNYNNTGGMQCGHGSSGCPYNTSVQNPNAHCWAHGIWSSTEEGQGQYAVYGYTDNFRKDSKAYLSYAVPFSTRCVYDGLNSTQIVQKPAEKDPDPEQSQKTCNPKTVTLSDTNMKVTQYNMGDDPACPRSVIEGMSGVTFVPVGTNCSSELCCWYGVTAAGNTCTNVGGIYSGCNRTVCKWQAAKKICETIGDGWKLPNTSNSMANWYLSNSTASTGLMLCDHSLSGADASMCSDMANCPASYDGRCCPANVWARSDSGSNAQSTGLGGGTWKENTYNKAFAFSVRCAKE